MLKTLPILVATSLFLLSPTLANQEEEKPIRYKTLLPGIDFLLSPMNILDPFTTQKPRVFDLPAFDDVTNSSCPFVIPEEYLVAEAFKCHLVPETHLITSAHDLMYSFKSKCPVFDNLLGIKNSDFKWTRRQFKKDKIVFYSKSVCSKYSVSLNPSTYLNNGKIEFPALSDWYANLVADLPNELNATSLIVFDKFISSYGDHVATKCLRMGGILD